MQFQILGPLRVTDSDEREITLGGIKPAALLAMLLLRPNEVVASDRLIEDLWDGQPPPTAAKSLQVHISRLRRALGSGNNGDAEGPIATTRGGYVLQVDPDQIDALRFERLVREGCAGLAEGAHARASARLRASLALWRGDALADFPYASFAQDAIGRLDGLRAVALESAVEAELALGRHAELIPELKSLVKRHPLSEHLRAQLMLALYRAGRQAEALGVYHAARRALVEQLGIEPGAELRDMERAILAQDAELAPPAAEQRPRAERAEKSPRGVLVGYEGELTALEDVLEQALLRQGRLALISGEPGVGKTRLADELSSVAHARGAEVVWGRCRSGGGAPAYWPWIQVLRALLSDLDPVALRAELGPGGAVMTQLLPELRDALPELDVDEQRDPQEARFQLFDATAKFLLRAAAERPIVVVLDDLHAADHATLSMLEFVGAAVPEAPILVVGTYRDTELAPGNALSATLSEVARTTDCLQLVLTGLSREDTAHFVELSAGVAPMPVLAAAIQEASSGNPLFVTELVRLMRAEDRLHELEENDTLALPRGIDQVISRRLSYLSEPCRRTLASAAVIGRDFDIALLERVSDSPADDLLAHIEEALAARVVEAPAIGGTVRFSHDLVRQTLYAAIGGAERRRLHNAVASAMEELCNGYPGQKASDLAHHFVEALPVADPGKAVRYLVLAGDRAADLCAHQEAVGHYSQATEIGATDAGVLCELYVKLAEQLVVLPDLRGAREVIEHAEALLADRPDPLLEGRVTVARAHLGMLDASTLDEARIFDAIALFEEIGDPAGAARGWSALVVMNCGRSDRLQGGEAAERMLDCAKRAGSHALINQAMRDVAGTLALGAAPIPKAIPRARALFEDADDPYTRARILNCIASMEASRGRFDEARSLIGQARTLVGRADRRNLEGFLLSVGARLELHARNPHRAEELARGDCAELESQGMVRYLSSELCFLVDALIAQGRLEEAAVQLERAAPMAAPDDADALQRQARSRARLEFARGDLVAAEGAARESLAHVEQAMAPDEHAECLLVLANVLVAAGRDGEAHEAARQALAHSEERGHEVFVAQARDLLGTAQPVAAG